MTFSEFIKAIDIAGIEKYVRQTDNTSIPAIIAKPRLDYHDFLLLLSPAAEPFIELLIARARNVTRQQFGNTMHLYAPLYLSNECDNCCAYCGFNKNRSIRRKTLQPEEIEQELVLLRQMGFQHILLLTGESSSAGVDYVCSAVARAVRSFPYVSLEIFAASEEGYRQLASAGANGLTLYQETYHRPTYDRMHISGPKKDYEGRLDSPERALQAGIRKAGLGALLGLYDWRIEMACLGAHAQYLAKKFWRAELSVSFPRLRDISGNYYEQYQVSDRHLLQIVAAFRLFLPWVDLVISTREPAFLRDQLIDIGITVMSAGSKTNPGGYAQADTDEQFSIADTRTLEDIKQMLRSKGLDPILKDWAYELQKE